jgi:hypothetical protein
MVDSKVKKVSISLEVKASKVLLSNFTWVYFYFFVFLMSNSSSTSIF